jgi:hypothetical protein
MRFACLALLLSAAASFAADPPPPLPGNPKADLAALRLEAVAAAQPQPAPAAPQFMRGAKPAPVEKLRAVPRFPLPQGLGGVPAQFAVVPKQLSMWGNSQYGCCVSSQEAFTLAANSTRCLGPDKEVFVPEKDLIAWARKYGLLNGADLPQVMDLMAKYGMTVNGVTYKDGSYYSVDFGNVTELQTALYVGPVNIAIDANALPSGAGSKSGWYAVGKGRYPNTDHCVALTGYGRADYLYQQLGVPLPAGLAADKPGYLLFTWNTIGFVDQDWLVSTCTECYVRNPTTVGMSPPPDPTPVPPAPPVPPVPPGPNPPTPGKPFTGTIASVQGYVNGVPSGPPVLVVTPAGGAADVEESLKAAGFSPELIAAVAKLMADIARKADKATIRADILAILFAFMAGM